MLLLDAGNSRVKWAWLEAGHLHHPGVLARHGMRLEYLVQQEGPASARPQRIFVSNVAGEEFADQLARETQSLWRVQPEFISAQACAFGVHNAYTRPVKLGADRWAALVAAHHIQTGAACIIDCGTAITVDTLDADGRHQGGVILPGLHSMRHALISNTHGILDDAETEMSSMTPFAHDTASAVSSGTLYAVVAALDRIIATVNSRLTIQAHFITGGDAVRIMPLLEVPCRHEPLLVLQGLAVIAARDPL